MTLKRRAALPVRLTLQRISALLYRTADAASAAAFPNEARPLPAAIAMNGATIDPVEDIGEFTGLGRAVTEAEIVRGRSLNYRSEWLATPRPLRNDHWFYLSSKTYLFANAAHFADGTFARNLGEHIPSDGHVLDFGGGSGDLTLQLASAGYRMAFIELNSLQRDFMRFRIHRHGLSDAIRVLDPWAGIPHDAFDAVLAMDVIEHLPNPEYVLRNQLLPARKQGGVLVENSPFFSDPGNPMHHDDFGFEAMMAECGLVEKARIHPARLWATATDRM